MNTNWNNWPVGEIVAKLPEAAELFKARKIDFCCGGHRPLGDVLREQAIDGAELFARLDAAYETLQKNHSVDDFLSMASHELTNYIEGRHHAYLRSALPDIGEIFTVVLKAHGAGHPSLFQLHGLFGRLRIDLEQHLVKEEVLLFPGLQQDDAHETARLALEIIAEHEAAGVVLKQMRAVAQDYEAPADACGTYRFLLEQLAELEGDLFQHIHLENNILLKDIRAKEDGRVA